MRTIFTIGHRKARGRPLRFMIGAIFAIALLMTPALVTNAQTSSGNQNTSHSGGAKGTVWLTYDYDSSGVLLHWYYKKADGTLISEHRYSVGDDKKLHANYPKSASPTFEEAISGYCNAYGKNSGEVINYIRANYSKDNEGVWRASNGNIITWLSSADGPLHTCTYSNWADWTATEHERHKTCEAHRGSVGQEHKLHTYGDWSKWTDDGNGQHSRTRTCTVCGHVDTDRKAHDWGPWIDDKNGHAATNNPDSKLASGTHHRVCSTCGRYEEGVHEMGEAKVVKVKGETAGKKTVVYRRDCAKCPHKEFIEVTMKKKGTESKEWVIDGDAKTYSEDGCKSENYIKAHELQGVPTNTARSVIKSEDYWYAYPVESITNVSDHLALRKEGHYVPTYKITDRYGELPDTTMNTELVDHSAPQMIVAVNKNGMINGAKGTMNAGHKFVMAPNGFTRMETAWTNEKPTFLIQATDTLRDSTEAGIGVGKVTIVEVTPNKDGSIPKTSAKVVAELPLNGKTTDTVTWTPPNKSDVEGSRIYLFFASDKLTRTETLQTNALYNLYLQTYNGVANGLWNVKYPYQYEASKNADAGKVKDYYDSAASKAYGYDILHTMAAQVVTHCDFTGPTVKVLSEHKTTSNSIYSPHQQISIKLYDGQNIENDRSDLARFQLIGIKGDNTEDVIAESTIHDVTDDPYRLTVQEGGFHGDERKGMGLTWTDGQVLPAGSIVSAHMDDANTVTHTQEVFGRIEFDNKRNPVNQSQTLYKAFKVRAWDKVGNDTETYPIITGSQVTSQIRDAIDRSSYK